MNFPIFYGLKDYVLTLDQKLFNYYKMIKNMSKRLTPQEIKQRKDLFRDYIATHPEFKWTDIYNNKELSKLLYAYKGKVTLAIYDAVTQEQNPRDVSAEKFMPLVSYVSSMISNRFEKAGLAKPSLEDMKQDGMVGVLDAQEK